VIGEASFFQEGRGYAMQLQLQCIPSSSSGASAMQDNDKKSAANQVIRPASREWESSSQPSSGEVEIKKGKKMPWRRVLL